MKIYGISKTGRIHREMQEAVEVGYIGPKKKCRVCKRVLPVAEFSETTETRDGRKPKCRECERAYERFKEGVEQCPRR